ncbi:MAG: hypothetical protein P8J37_06965 [Fuerstiella sp.]|nr:hypothetical protein [Fuerstiella sp.]
MPHPDADFTTTASSSSPAACAVLLGASNLTLAWPRLISLVCRSFSTPVDVYTAHGMGRSYMLERTGFATGKLPGILRCGVWDALPAISDAVTTHALVTDLGNDLLYGCQASDVIDAAEESVQRLRTWNPRCRIVMTRPPTAAVHSLGRMRFLMFRSMLFPFSRLTLECIQQKTQELDDGICRIAEQFSAHTVLPDRKWYGLDPIHVRRRSQRRAFTEILAPWDTQVCAAPSSAQTLPSRPTAALRWVLGAERQTHQPSSESPGVSVFAY